LEEHDKTPQGNTLEGILGPEDGGVFCNLSSPNAVVLGCHIWEAFGKSTTLELDL
jgi:hypothetical protein